MEYIGRQHKGSSSVVHCRLQLWDVMLTLFFRPESYRKQLKLSPMKMHLAGPLSKWRDANYYYTKRVAARPN